VFHPGEHLRDELEARIWNEQALGAIMKIDPEIIVSIIEGNERITWKIAHSFAKAFGTSADYWMNLQRAWDERSK